MSGVLDIVKAGVVTGEDVSKLLQFARENNFALPAVNVVGTDTVNAVIEAAMVVSKRSSDSPKAFSRS